MFRFAAAGLLLLMLAVPAAAQSVPGPITITVRDNKFEPSEVAVPAGVKVELLVRNEQQKPAEFESNALHREKVVPPGASASVFIGPLKPGRYEFFDDFNPANKGVVVAR
jgi:hypothetical protein